MIILLPQTEELLQHNDPLLRPVRRVLLPTEAVILLQFEVVLLLPEVEVRTEVVPVLKAVEEVRIHLQTPLLHQLFEVQLLRIRAVAAHLPLPLPLPLLHREVPEVQVVAEVEDKSIINHGVK